MAGASRTRALAPSLIVCAALASLPFAMIGAGGHLAVDLGYSIHFWAVGVTALVATIGALALTVVGARRRDGRTVLIGGAFSLMAGLLALHGLSTPGVLIASSGVILIAGGLTLPVGAAALVLAANPGLRRHDRVRVVAWSLGGAIAAVLGAGVIGILMPGVVPALPTPRSPEALGLLAFTLGLLGVLGVRASATYLMTRRPRDLATAAGLAMLLASAPGAYLFGWTEAGFWMSHGLELVGLAMVVVAAALDLRAVAPSRALVGDLRASELVAAEEAYLGATVRALLMRLAEKDGYTEGHTRRVALLAVEVGEALGLPPHELRRLAIAGLMHDIGKLRVPDEILMKPGKLTEAEFGVIRMHPAWGEELLDELGGFHPTVRAMVLDHHERLDGTGYPRRLRDAQLTQGARILGVCDVYDALVTPRVYRGAWSHDDAMALLRLETGTHFDAVCVEALAGVLAGEATWERAAA